MADTPLGRLLVRLGVDNREFERGLAASKRQAASAARELRTLLAGVGAGFATREIFQAARAAQQIQGALRVATGSSQAAGREFAFVRSEANRLGLELQSTAQQYAKFAAAAQGTALSGKAARDVFTGVAEAATALGLSSEQTEGALRALEQMISKGNVQAEELRGQLGERIPGAFQLAARAMGVTTAKLNDMLKAGEVAASDLLPRLATEFHKTFGAEAAQQANSPLREIERFKTALFELEKDIAEGGFVKGLSEGLKEVRETFKDPTIRQGLVDIGKGIGEIVSIAATGLRHVDLIVSALTALAGIKLGQVVIEVFSLGRAVALLATTNPLLLGIVALLAAIGKISFEQARREIEKFTLTAEEAEQRIAKLREERAALGPIEPSDIGVQNIEREIARLQQIANTRFQEGQEGLAAALGFGAAATADANAFAGATNGVTDAVRDLKAETRAAKAAAKEMADALEDSFRASSFETEEIAKALGDMRRERTLLNQESQEGLQDLVRQSEAAAEEAARAAQAPFIEMSEGIQDALVDGFVDAFAEILPEVDGFAGDILRVFERTFSELIVGNLFSGVLSSLAGGGGIVGGGGLNPATGLSSTASLDQVLSALRGGVQEGAETGTRSGVSGAFKSLQNVFGGGGGGVSLANLFTGAGGVGGFASSALGLAGGGLLGFGIGSSFGGGATRIGAGVGGAIGSIGGPIWSAIGAAVGAAAVPMIRATIDIGKATLHGENPFLGSSVSEARLGGAAAGFAVNLLLGGLFPVATVIGPIIADLLRHRPQGTDFGFTLRQGTGASPTEVQSAFGVLGLDFSSQRIGPESVSFIVGLGQLFDSLAKNLDPAQIASISARLSRGDLFTTLHERDASAVSFGFARIFRDQVKGIIEGLGGATEGVFGSVAAGTDFVPPVEGSVQVLNAFLEAFGKVQAFLKGDEITSLETAFAQLEQQFQEVSDAATAWGIDLADLTDALAARRLKLATDFAGQLERAVLAFTDPVAAALAEQSIAAEKRLAEARVAEAEGALGAIANAERLSALERARIIEQAGQPLKDLLASLTGSTSSPLGLAQVVANAEDAFDTILAAVRGGDLSQVDELTSAAQTLIDVSRDAFGGSAEFFERFNFVVATLQNVLAGLPGFATGGAFTVGGAGGTDSRVIAFRATPGERVTIETAAQVARNVVSLSTYRAARGLPGFATGGAFTVSSSTPGSAFLRDANSQASSDLARELARGNTERERGNYATVQMLGAVIEKLDSLERTLARGARSTAEIAARKRA